jgi:hypothetical protein
MLDVVEIVVAVGVVVVVDNNVVDVSNVESEFINNIIRPNVCGRFGSVVNKNRQFIST